MKDKFHDDWSLTYRHWFGHYFINKGLICNVHKCSWSKNYHFRRYTWTIHFIFDTHMSLSKFFDLMFWTIKFLNISTSIPNIGFVIDLTSIHFSSLWFDLWCWITMFASCNITFLNVLNQQILSRNKADTRIWHLNYYRGFFSGD